jgi:flavin-dependent dehydrogenase
MQSTAVKLPNVYKPLGEVGFVKVAIIGCGAVGGWLAWQLARRGEDVTIIERKKRVGGKACSGLVSERIWDFIPKNEKLVENTIEEVAIHFPRKTAIARFKPRMLAFDRPAFDNYIAKLAAEAGAELRLGSNFETLREEPDGVIVTSDRGEERFDRVVGCDGAVSMVRAICTRTQPRYRAGIQCFQQVKDRSTTADVWPTPGGFFWRIPKGGQIEWGLFEKQELGWKRWKAFAAERGLETQPIQAAVIPEGVITTRSDKVALCGDAAGLTKPWSGGGILWGITAAKMLLDSWPDFRTYNRDIKKRFSTRIAIGSFGTRVVTWFGAVIPWVLPREFDSDWLL